MVEIIEVDIISVDQNDETWEIEGEIVFESDLCSPFSVTYNPEDDELEDLEIEIDPGRFDRRRLKEMILDAARRYED